MSGNSSTGILFYSHNQAKYVYSGLDSIVAQEFAGPAELIIIDDGSPDGTVEVIRSWISDHKDQVNQKFKSIRFTYREDGVAKGQTATLLEGLGQLDSDFIFILEGDDQWILPTHIQAMKKILEEYSWISACGSSWVSLSDANLVQGAFEKPANLSFINSLWDSRRLLSSNFQTLSAMGYRGDAIKKVLPNLMLCKEVADLGLNIFVSQEGPIYWCEQVSLMWRFIPTSAWRKIPIKEQIRRSISMLSEYSQYLDSEVQGILKVEILARKKGLSTRSKFVFTLSHPFLASQLIKRKIAAVLVK